MSVGKVEPFYDEDFRLTVWNIAKRYQNEPV